MRCWSFGYSSSRRMKLQLLLKRASSWWVWKAYCQGWIGSHYWCRAFTLWKKCLALKGHLYQQKKTSLCLDSSPVLFRKSWGEIVKDQTNQIWGISAGLASEIHCLIRSASFLLTSAADCCQLDCRRFEALTSSASYHQELELYYCLGQAYKPEPCPARLSSCRRWVSWRRGVSSTEPPWFCWQDSISTCLGEGPKRLRRSVADS